MPIHEEQFLHYRDSLEKLGEVRDQIISFWRWQSMDESRKKMWISDAQDVYYQLLTALDLQKQNTIEGNDDYQALQYTLRAARSRVEQVISELKSSSNHRSENLYLDLQNTFEAFWKPLAIEAGVKELLSTKLLQAPQQPVIEISGSEYHLPCSICSEIAFVFRIEIPVHEELERLVYKGITHTGDLALRHSRAIFNALQQSWIGKAHEYIQALHAEKGIDAYCPKCDRIYCHGHYHLKEIWEEGFYDCTLGTCPNGHRRIVDD